MAFSFLMLAAPLAVLAIPGSFGRYLEHYRQPGPTPPFLRRTILACGGLALAGLRGRLAQRRWFSLLDLRQRGPGRRGRLGGRKPDGRDRLQFPHRMFTALRNIRLVSVMQLVNSVAFAVLGVGLLLGWQCNAESVLAGLRRIVPDRGLWAGCRLRRVWHARRRPSAAPHAALWSKRGPLRRLGCCWPAC